jgi:acyl dehydratase
MFSPTTTGLMHFEDFILGQPLTVGAERVTREDIKAFARRYDPQLIHLDEEAAKTSIVGGLCASGFHTCCLMMRMLCDGFLLRTASLGAPGLEELKWVKPVRPDDVLSVRIMAHEKRVMASRPNVGLVRTTYDVVNQTGEAVLTSWCNQIIRVRDPKPVADGDAAARAKSPALPDLWDVPPEQTPQSTGLFFEERALGETRRIGEHTFDREGIIAFATLYDPQPFHLDEEAGKASLFGGLAASGWQTAVEYIRFLVADRQREEAKLRAAGQRLPVYGPSPGFKNLRWIKPVLMGDTLEYRHRISGKVDLKSRPDRGMLQSFTQARNQRGELVFSYEGAILVERLKPA